MGKLQEMMAVIAQADQWRMMEGLLGIELVPSKAIRSPLRQGDEHPSFNAWKGKDGKVRWKDFAMENGDIYHLIMELRGCNFRQAVAEAYDLASGGLVKPAPSGKLYIPPRPHVYAHITAYGRDWDECDQRYWSKYGIGPKEAKEGALMTVGSARVVTGKRPDGYTIRHFDSSPLYAWWFQDGIEARYKLYRPLHHERAFRFISNSKREDIYGLKQFQKNKPGILVGGQKDALVSRHMWECNAASFNSEGMLPDENMVMAIMMRCSKLFILYDSDKAGRTNQARIVQQYPFITPLSFDHPLVKDPADLMEHRSDGSVMDIIEKIRREIHR